VKIAVQQHCLKRKDVRLVRAHPAFPVAPHPTARPDLDDAIDLLRLRGQLQRRVQGSSKRRQERGLEVELEEVAQKHFLILRAREIFANPRTEDARNDVEDVGD
jgi:hypothetical protein